jgi:putative ABC transport system permease protein
MLKELGLEAEGGTLDLEKGAVVIGTQVKTNFYAPYLRPGQPPTSPPDLLGQTIQLTLPKYTKDGEEIRKTLRLRVVGIIAETRGEHDYQMYMPLEEVTNLNQWVMGRRVDRSRDGYPMVMVTVEDVSQVLDIADQITALGYQTYTPQSFVQGINSFFLVLQIIFGGIGGISLLVAAIGIANTMTMAILERTREIGLMKAIGATNRNVMGVFLGEAAGIGLLGGIGGVALGWGAGQVLNIIGMVYLANQAQQLGYLPSTITVHIPAWLPIFAIVFATLIGTLSGLYPALRAATLVPVMALKYE